MQTKFTWRKKSFSDLYSIYSNGQQIGKLKKTTFSQTTTGELNGKSYTFKTKGFISPYTEIMDSIDKKVIGVITYNNWMTKATISVNNKKIIWEYDNVWSTKWRIFDSEGIKIQYYGSSTKGQIDSNIDDTMLLLSGLYVINYYRQMTVAVLIAALIPITVSIWTTVLR